jgi:hypothetical protein
MFFPGLISQWQAQSNNTYLHFGACFPIFPTFLFADFLSAPLFLTRSAHLLWLSAGDVFSFHPQQV